MSTPSKVTSPRRTRKTKSTALPEVRRLTSGMMEAHSRGHAFKEIQDIMDNWTEAERKVVGHVIINFSYPQNTVKEIRRLLGESIAKCKIIPFPVGGKRGIQIAKEA